LTAAVDLDAPVRLVAGDIVLRELCELDAEALNRHERDPAVVRYQLHAERTIEESRDYILRVLEGSRPRPRQLFDLAVCIAGNDELIGRAGINVTNPAQREAVLWYVIEGRFWGMGYATRAARRLLTFGFEALGLHRIYADIDARNRSSLRVAEKLGMRREAHFRQNMWVKGEWTDSIIFAILEDDWRAAQPLI